MMYVHTRSQQGLCAGPCDEKQIVWKYEPKQDPNVIPVMCCDTSIAVSPMATARSPASGRYHSGRARRKTGRWSGRLKNGDPAKGATGTSAPLVVKDKVLIGISGGEFGVQAHMTAYDIKTGKLVWRGYSEGTDDQILVDEKTTELGKPIGRIPAQDLAGRSMEDRRRRDLGAGFPTIRR